MRYPDLPAEKRLAAAWLSGEIIRVTSGNLSHLGSDEKLARVWAVTRDPAILGHELGPHLADEHPTAGTRAAIELLRAAGANEAVAEENAQWQRERRVREQRGAPRT
jgi:hypothetical protein